VALDDRLPAILRGAEEPSNAAEEIEFAELCVLKTLYTAAAQFYADAFLADPKLVENVPAGRRYNAARAAALAGCGRGKDAGELDDRRRANWRRQAREWLRQDLIAWRKALANGTAETRAQVLQQLRHWQTDGDLAGLRDPGPLETLPQDERHQCFAFWNEVAAVLSGARATK
jgi:serine/threonine-protein kinase